MKKIILLLFLILTACTVTDQGTEQISGTKGLVLNYEPGEPKSEYLGNQKVRVTVNYENQGSAAAENINFNLVSFDKSILPFSEKNKNPSNLGGRTESNPEGFPSRYVEWETTISVPSKEIDSFDQIISVVTCYDYTTSADGLICLEPYTRDSECVYDVKDMGASQGAPIVITDVNRQISEDEIIVEVFFDNKGSGNPIVDKDCVTPDLKNIDIINLDEVKIGGTRRNPRLRLSCIPSTIRLDNGKGYTICRTSFNSKMRIEEQIYVDLDYRYREKMQEKRITIVSPD